MSPSYEVDDVLPERPDVVFGSEVESAALESQRERNDSKTGLEAS